MGKVNCPLMCILVGVDFGFFSFLDNYGLRHFPPLTKIDR